MQPSSGCQLRDASRHAIWRGGESRRERGEEGGEGGARAVERRLLPEPLRDGSCVWRGGREPLRDASQQRPLPSLHGLVPLVPVKEAANYALVP